MTRSLEESGEKVTQLSDSVAFFKSIIPDMKKAIASAEKSIDLLKNRCAGIANIRGANAGAIIGAVNSFPNIPLGLARAQIIPARNIPSPVPPKNMEQICDTYESANPFSDTLTKEEIMREVAKAYGLPPKL
ncbi:3767_t:CDS:2, partial [Funneliformis geosporum]